MSENPQRVRDHWYWRPGWSVGRRYYTWHLTFAGHPDVVALAESYRPALEAAPELDVIPAQWLHLTMQGVGFIDEVNNTDVEAIVDAARRRSATLEPFAIAVGSPYVDVEAVQIIAQPPEPVAALRRQLRAAIADVWGEARVPEAAEPFLPHMSLAYVNRDGPAARLSAVLDAVDVPPARIEMTSCELIIINRDEMMYKWDTYASVALGSRRV